MKSMILMNGMRTVMVPYPLKAMLSRGEALRFEVKPLDENKVEVSINVAGEYYKTGTGTQFNILKTESLKIRFILEGDMTLMVKDV